MRGSITADDTKLLVMDRDPLGAAGLNDMLGERGCGCIVVSSVAGVLKSIKSCSPPAVIVRAALDHPDFGCDHILRVLRHTYPSLPIVITSTELNRRVEAISDEFGIPCLIEPFDAAELFAALRSGYPGLADRVSGRAIDKRAGKVVPG